jgi:hypothetical protein
MEQMSQIGRLVEIRRDCVSIKVFIDFISLDGRSAEVITMKKYNETGTKGTKS